jgi:YHS domain-containing protein
MFRFLTYVLVMLFLLTIVRSVVSFILRGFSELMQARSGPQSRPAPGQSVPLTGELKKDPVCGTYTAAASSIQQTIRGQTLYFCSPQCRDKYVASLT